MRRRACRAMKKAGDYYRLVSQNLGDKEVPELGVLGDPASHPHRDHVSKSLDLMDDSLCVGHL